MKRIFCLIVVLMALLAFGLSSVHAVCTQGIADSFKQEILAGKHSNAVAASCTAANVPWDCCTAASTGTSCNAAQWKVALYGSAATYDHTTAVYSSTNEIASGNGYTTGGMNIDTFTVGGSGATAWVTFTTNPAWSSSTITAECAVIYNSTNNNAVMMVLKFNSTSSTNGTWTLVLPTADASNALLRIN